METTAKTVTDTTATLESTISQVAAMLKEAATKYGPDAVDLAMVVYQIEAIQQIVSGLFLLLLVHLTVKALRYLLAITAEGWRKDEGPTVSGRIAGLIVGVIFGICIAIYAADRLLSVTNWAAAFGYPELMMAKRALEAAGLM